MRDRNVLRGIAAIAAIGVTTACASDAPTAPESSIWPQPVVSSPPEAAACQAFDFDSFQHGAVVSSVSALGVTAAVTATAYTGPDDGGAMIPTDARAYFTGTVTPGTGGTQDLEYGHPDARCPGCQGLGNLLIIESPGDPTPFDNIWGGRLTFTFTGLPDDKYYVKSVIVVDNDWEPPVGLFVDGVKVGESTVMGDGSVQTITPTSYPFISSTIMIERGTAGADGVLASGAMDSLYICEVSGTVVGDEGCTPGYWKNHETAWVTTDFAPGDELDEVFADNTSPVTSVPYYGLGDRTLMQALNFGGGSGLTGAARILFRAAVAALLNASSENVEYPRTTDQVIDAVVAALRSGDRQTMLDLATELDRDNNLGCPLGRDGVRNEQ